MHIYTYHTHTCSYTRTYTRPFPPLNPSGVGATAGDEECWELFKDLFYPIIHGWHGYDAYTQKHPVDLNPDHLKVWMRIWT
ncbi:hypothetical protein EON63_04470 [archaeon]|nr:MAG: hypothetical protein EON63_04470 [archaeon]